MCVNLFTHTMLVSPFYDLFGLAAETIQPVQHFMWLLDIVSVAHFKFVIDCSDHLDAVDSTTFKQPWAAGVDV